MMSRDEALTTCETLLGQIKSAGAEDAIVNVESTEETHARFADNSITTSGRAENVTVTATVWVGKRRGAATGNDASPGALKQLANEAVEIARVSPVHGEYVPTLGATTYAAERSYSAATENVDLEARTTVLSAVLDVCRREKVTGAGFHSANASANATATANGNRRYFRSSEGSLRVTARTTDGTGSGSYAGDHFDLARLDVEKIAREAVRKAVQSRNPQPIEPGVYPVILESQAVADLLSFLNDAFEARTAEEGRSAFSAKDGKTRAGEQLFNERLNLYSDPMHAEMPATPATDEGVPATRLSLVKGGVIDHLVSPRYWAQRQKREASPGPVNYILESSAPPVALDTMIEGMERGLLITRFWYVRLVDGRSLMLTGLTRDGLWWIEKGRIQRPVRNLRFNQSVIAMLAGPNVEAIGAPERRSPMMVPPLKLAGFTFTSISDAI
jgi:predicted Zn-dependent protease